MIFLSDDNIGEHFDGLDLAEGELDGVAFTDCTFERCTFDGAILRGCRLAECTFVDCDLVGTKLPETSLTNVTFRRGRAMGVDWSVVRQLTLRLRFEGVKLDYSSFVDLKLPQTEFTECSLVEATFDGCDLTGCRFTGSRLEGATIRHCTLVGTDLRDTRGCAIDPRTCTLRRTRVDVDTATAALISLGIECPDLVAMVGG